MNPTKNLINMINSKDNIETYKGNTTNYSKNTSVSKNKTIIVAKLIHERNNAITIFREKINNLEYDIENLNNINNARLNRINMLEKYNKKLIGHIANLKSLNTNLLSLLSQISSQYAKSN